MMNRNEAITARARFAGMLRVMMKEKGLSNQKDFAGRLRIGYTAVNAWLRGKGPLPTARQAKRLVDAAHPPIDGHIAIVIGQLTAQRASERKVRRLLTADDYRRRFARLLKSAKRELETGAFKRMLVEVAGDVEAESILG